MFVPLGWANPHLVLGLEANAEQSRGFLDEVPFLPRRIECG
jgi:hypothetical protein